MTHTEPQLRLVRVLSGGRETLGRTVPQLFTFHRWRGAKPSGALFPRASMHGYSVLS